MRLVFLTACAVAALAVLAFLFWLGRGSRQAALMESAYRPTVDSGKSVTVLGWREDELSRIVAAFGRAYALPPSAVLVSKRGDERFALTFPGDIEPRLLFFLVNYLSYPRDFDLKDRRIVAFCRVVLDSSYGIPDPQLKGVGAVVYVPAEDTEFDNVFVRTLAGTTFKVPFSRMIWSAVEDPRMPKEVGDALKG
jgi:hypothetical protein